MPLLLDTPAIDRLLRLDAESEAYYARWGKVAYEQRPEAERAAQKERDLNRHSLQVAALTGDDREYVLLKSREASLLPIEQDRLRQLHAKFFGLNRPAVSNIVTWDGRAPSKAA